MRFKDEVRESIAKTKELLLQSKNKEIIFNLLKDYVDEVKVAYVLRGIPEPGISYYSIMVNGEKMIHFELETDVEPHKVSEVEVETVEEYGKTLKNKFEKLEFQSALELSKIDMEES